MLCPLPRKHAYIWKYSRQSSGSTVAFNVDTLVDYLISTGDFSDPETRIPFTDDELKAIDSVAQEGKLNKPSVYAASYDPVQHQRYIDANFRRDALEGLERCAGEVVADILNLIERPADPDAAQLHLMMVELPAFADYFRQLKEADRAYSQQCIESWKEFLRGPPNKPVPDPFGLVACCIHFFNVQSVGSVAAVAMGGGAAAAAAAAMHEMQMAMYIATGGGHGGMDGSDDGGDY